MRHFIAYHNPQTMGYPYPGSMHQRVLTNRPVNHILGNTVWVVSFEGASHDYSLAGVFQVTETGESQEARFKHFVAGEGHIFRPWPRIKGMDWFPEIMRATGRFRFGVHQMKDSAVIAGLIKTGEQTGYKVE